MIAASLALAAAGLTSCLELLDASPQPYQPRFWMRIEAYQTAVDAALARSDISRGDPSLIARDFTVMRGRIEGEHNVDNFNPCARTASDLIGPDKINCTASPGVGGVRDDPRCPRTTCVTIQVRSETWADPVSRQVILSALADHDRVCADAQTYGPNKRFDALAVGCSQPDWKPVRLAVEVKPRLFEPCVYKELPANRYGRHSYKPICSNPEATLMVVG